MAHSIFFMTIEVAIREFHCTRRVELSRANPKTWNTRRGNPPTGACYQGVRSWNDSSLKRSRKLPVVLKPGFEHPWLREFSSPPSPTTFMLRFAKLLTSNLLHNRSETPTTHPSLISHEDICVNGGLTLMNFLPYQLKNSWNCTLMFWSAFSWYSVHLFCHSNCNVTNVSALKAAF